MDTREYYPCQIRLDREIRLVAWYCDDQDGFVRDVEGKLLIADSLKALADLLQARDIALQEEEPAEFDFDRISAWCATPSAESIDCNVFLNAWNFLDDLTGLHVGAVNKYPQASRDALAVYDRLFWGCNIPAVTPPGETFVPTWTADDLAQIRRVMSIGMESLRAELQGHVTRKSRID